MILKKKNFYKILQMPKSIVINTTPILTLIAAYGTLELLNIMYEEVIIPLEVRDEILSGGKYDYGILEFQKSSFLKISNDYVNIPTTLYENLDKGEASVITTAIENNIPLVCIDETEGRRWARIYQLNLTGSLGIIIAARRRRINIQSLREVIPNILNRGIWISEHLIEKAIQEDES